MGLNEELQGKSPQQKADIKAEEVVKQDYSEPIEKKGLAIQIQSITKIEGGIQVLATAYRDGEQLGFGDGTVEVERFNIFNPPVLVDDPNGDIVREWTDRDGVAHTRTLREDPAEALKQRLSQIVALTAKDSDKIEKGKVGNTTSVFSSVAGANSPVDGDTVYDSSAVAWATIQAAAGTHASSTNTAQDTGFQDGASANTFANLARVYFLFDTSAIPDTDTISASTLTLFGSTRKFDQNSNSPTFNLYDPSVANTAAIATTDHVASSWNTTALATAITYAAWDNSGAGNVFTLNASGIANVSKTGISHFGMREATYDVANAAPTSAGSSNRTFISTYFVDQTGTSLDPFLTVVHAGAAGGTSQTLTMTGVGS